MTDDETRVMSRALTRGATMLDDACDGCGNPLFRYQGEVFCPVCRERRTDGDEEEENQRTETAEGFEEVEETTETVADDGVTGTDAEEVDGVNESLRVLARRLARDAAESSDDPDAVERRLDALERTLDLLR